MRGALGRYGTVLALAVLVLALSLAADNFLSLGNLANVLKNASFMAILALGFNLALITSELDLSFANVASLCSIIAAVLLYGGYAVPVGIAACLALGAACGLANGLLVTRFRIPSLIATLAVGTMANGFAFMLTGGVDYVGRLPAPFLFLGRGAILGVPVLIVWTASAVLVAQFVVKETRLGAHMVATGEAEEAARLAGIPVKRMKTLGLTLSGFLAGLGGLLLTAHLSSSNATIAGGFLMSGIAAVLLGMTTIEVGKPNVAGTVVGTLIIGVLGNGLTLMGAQYYYQDIILGLIILGSVGVSASQMMRAAFGVSH